MNTIWKTYDFTPDTPTECIFGPLHVAVRGNQLGWDIALNYHDSSEGEVSEDPCRPLIDPGTLTWEKFCVGGQPQLRFQPVLPDRGVVVRPETSVTIASAHKAQLFFTIPVWVKIITQESPEHILADIPTEILSNTWFGDPTEGELAYSLKQSASFTAPRDGLTPHLSVCPIEIENSSPGPLEFTRICIHLEHAALYLHKDYLICDQVKVQFRGAEHPSQIRFQKHNNQEYQRISPARIAGQKRLMSKSFSFIRNVTGF